MKAEIEFRVAVADGELIGHRGGGGPPALVLHGGPGLPDYLGALAAELGEACSTVRYAQRGCPPSTVTEAASVDVHVDDAVAVLDALELERVWAIGHSWGGHLALHLAVAHPERLYGVVCVGTLGASNDVIEEFEANLTRSLDDAQRARAAELEGLESPTQADRMEGFSLIWPYYFADPQAAPPIPFDRFGESKATWESISEHFERRTLELGLPAVELPTLFVHGVSDPIPMRAATATARLMPNATVVELDDCGHFPWLERPGETARAVGRLLAAS